MQLGSTTVESGFVSSNAMDNKSAVDSKVEEVIETGWRTTKGSKNVRIRNNKFTCVSCKGTYTHGR
jgi:predicted nucleic-acid-binding Zn-ribbon protein